MTQKTKRVKKSDFKYQLFIESYGVKICITTNKPEVIENFKIILRKYLLDLYTETEKTEAAQHFLFVCNTSEKDTLYKNGKSVFSRLQREKAFEYLGSEVRRTIAEFAVGRVFIHSGVVAWKGKVILIPGTSFSGKTSLTAALVKRGADYYSDEYAILDEEGFVYPFPKMLSLRGVIDDRKQVDIPVEKLGGIAGTEKIRVGAVLITEYKVKARWNPKILSPAKGMIEILHNSVAIRQNPQFTLDVLNKVAGEALIVKSKRGDVSKSAGLILKFINDNL